MLQWVFSNIAENAGIQKLQIHNNTFGMDINHMFDKDICICYKDNEEFKSCINDRYIRKIDLMLSC